jgi:hypothetical protein
MGQVTQNLYTGFAKTRFSFHSHFKDVTLIITSVFSQTTHTTDHRL